MNLLSLVSSVVLLSNHLSYKPVILSAEVKPAEIVAVAPSKTETSEPVQEGVLSEEKEIKNETTQINIPYSYRLEEPEKPKPKKVYKIKEVAEQEVKTEIFQAGKAPEFPDKVNSPEIGVIKNDEISTNINHIKYYSNLYGADETKQLRIAKCESGYRMSAVSPSGKHKGVYQFLPSTFYGNAKRLLTENPNAFDGEEPNLMSAKHQANLAVWMMQVKNQWHQWSCK